MFYIGLEGEEEFGDRVQDDGFGEMVSFLFDLYGFLFEFQGKKDYSEKRKEVIFYKIYERFWDFKVVFFRNYCDRVQYLGRGNLFFDQRSFGVVFYRYEMILGDY